MIVPPPELVRQRAWECAYVLRTDFPDAGTIEDRIRAEVILCAGPDAIGWNDAGRMLAMARRLLGVRV